MKKLLTATLTLLFAVSLCLATQGNSTNTNASPQQNSANKPKKKRPPVFRASKDQVKQAQAILKQRGLYAGEQTGKLDADTRAALKKYQEAEGLKVTGTLNRATLEKMNITLTDKQKAT
jgi:peptidoglycan hydrolase-like protein with peptidoglycan-binding domain